MLLDCSAVNNLKPTTLVFLTKLIDKVKESSKDYIHAKKAEIAEYVQKDSRTVARYLDELEENNLIQQKGIRGRNGGLVVTFNKDIVLFDVTDNVITPSEGNKTAEQIVEELTFKKPQPKKPKRKRRKKHEIEDAKLVKQGIDKVNSDLNDILEKQRPSKEFFDRTENPTEEYKTYLITRLYNAYVHLFIDQNNGFSYEEEDEMERNNMEHTPAFRSYRETTPDYDVLPTRFMGTAMWEQFKRVNTMCTEMGINPAVYLSAHFSRSVFLYNNRNAIQPHPFVNTLVSDKSEDIYKGYVKTRMNNISYASFNEYAPEFGGNIEVAAIISAWKQADDRRGFMNYKSALRYLLEPTDTKESLALSYFYNYTKKKLREQKVSVKSRDTIKKFLFTHSVYFLYGASMIPRHILLGMQSTYAALQSAYLNETLKFNEEPDDEQRHVNGLIAKRDLMAKLVYPHLEEEDAKEATNPLFISQRINDEVPAVLNLITDWKGVNVSIFEMQEALKEYGEENIPLDKYGLLDIKRVIEFMETNSDLELEEKEQITDHIDPEKVVEEPVETKSEHDILVEELESLFD